MYSQTIDLSAQSSSNFYPVVFSTQLNFAEVAISSPTFTSGAAYNQNRIHFEISTHGCNDVPFSLNIREYACYDTKEITIGCIGRGTTLGAWAIWLRGGINYTCCTRNATPSLKTSDYTYGDEIYTVGTNYYGGSNTNVETIFTPQSTITDGSYSTRPITAPNITSLERGAYDHIVYNDASLLKWANCTDGSMKKVLIKSGTYNMTKGVNLSQAGTGYVLAEQGAVINSHVATAFSIDNTSVTTVIHNLSVICCASINSDYSCAFSSRYIDYLILYNCTATYENGTTIVKKELFDCCVCYNCEYYCADTYTTERISIKVFDQCKCYNCRCKHIIYNNSVSVRFTTDSYFYSHCRCISCTADIEFMQSLQGGTYSFRCYESCGECVGCVAEFYVDSGKSIPQFQYGFRACNYLSGCKETHPTSFDTAIRGIDNCSFISSTTASTGNSNTYVGNSCKIG